MHLYNTRTKTVEPFPLTARPITLYVCGITPYDTTHLGHAFTYVVNDTLIRYLEYLGHSVRYTQNVTDIDDDILRKADEVGEDWRSLGNPTAFHLLTTMAEQIVAAAGAGWRVAAAQTTLGRLGQIFGLRLGQAAPEKRVVEGWQQHLLRFT